MRTRLRSFAWLIIVTAAIASSCVGGPHILSGHGTFIAVTGQCCRKQPHNGVDFAGGFGDPVLAVAEGRVVRAGTMGPRCGVGVSIRHAFGLNTAYCHFSTVAVERGATVTRGQPIGTIGVSGDYGGVTHVHLMLGLNGDLDPMKYMVGCYEPGVEYPTEKIVLTYPVECRNR